MCYIRDVPEVHTPPSGTVHSTYVCMYVCMYVLCTFLQHTCLHVFANIVVLTSPQVHHGAGGDDEV